MAQEVALRISVQGQQELTKATANVNRLVAERKKLNKSLKDGSITQATYDKAIAKNNVNLKAARTNVNRLNKEILINNKVMKKGKGLTASITKGFGAMAVRLGAAYLGFAALSKIVTSATSIINNFDKANSKLRAILGKTRDEMDALRKSAKQFGSTTAFTATQVTELQTALAKLGFTEVQILNMTEGVLALAAASDTDLANAAEIAGSTMRAFGLDAEETNRVVDVMAKSFSTSALDIDKFKDSMGKVAPVAKSVGLTLEETTAMLGTLANAGLDASTSGTSLRNIFLQLAKHGLTWEEAQTKMAAATDRVNEGQELFGKRGVTAALIIMDMQAEIEALTESYNKATGSALEMAEAQLDNLIGDKLLLTSAWEGFILSVDEGSGVFSTAMRTMTSFLTDQINELQAWNEGALEFWDAFDDDKRAKKMLKWKADMKKKTEEGNQKTEAELELEKKKAAIAEKYNKLLEKYNKDQEKWDKDELKRKKDLQKKKDQLLKDNENAIKEQLDNEIDDYNNYLIKKAELEQEYYDSQLTQEQRELNAVEDKYFTLLEMAAKHGDDMTALIAAKEKEQEDIKKAADKRREESEKETNDKIAQDRRQLYNELVQVASFAVSAIGELGERRTSRNLEELDKMQQQGLISQEEADKKKEDVERKAFNRRKMLGISNVIINFAQGNAANFKDGLMAGLVASPIMTALMLAQIALIASEQFAQGGLVGGGVFEGPSHAKGGIKFASGGRLMEAEGGEAIINKRSTAMFKPQLSAMNAAGGGVKFADGGILNGMRGNFDMAGMNFGRGQVVVVESAITDSQNTVQNIQSNASI
jgi:TP901 family phage tail tape measure protein